MKTFKDIRENFNKIFDMHHHLQATENQTVLVTK